MRRRRERERANFGPDRRGRDARVDGFAEFAAAGAPVVPPSDLLPPGPPRYAGLELSFWQPVAVLPAALRWLFFAWMALGLVLGSIVTRIILSIVFIVAIISNHNKNNDE